MQPVGITYFNDTVSRLARGQFLKVPTLLGVNADEGDIFAVIDQLVATGTTNPVVTETLSEEINQVRDNNCCLS